MMMLAIQLGLILFAAKLGNFFLEKIGLPGVLGELAAGVLIKATGQDAVAGLAGVAQRLPLTLSSFGLAGVTLMGLPPSAGFLAKWLLIEAALAQGYWFIALVALAGGLLAAVYVFRVLHQAFLLAPAASAIAAVPRTLEWTTFALAAASVAVGLRGVELVELLGVGVDENTAIVVRGNEFEVMGAGYVAVYDHGAMLDSGGRFYFLSPGQRFNMETREATRVVESTRPIERVVKKPWR